MIRYLHHPRYRRLNDAAVSGVLTPPMRRHLQNCPKCRAYIQSVRALYAEAADMEVPRSSTNIAERIRLRVAAGEIVLLPGSSAQVGELANSSRRLMPRVVALASAAAVLIVLIANFGSHASAAGTAGELRFTPNELVPGSTVTVEYRSSGVLSESDAVTLRGRWRTVTDVSYNTALLNSKLATLAPVAKNYYRGSFVVPEGAVFGAFAVEDIAGISVDANNGRLWTLYERESGDPSFSALTQEFNDRLGHIPQRALEALRERAAIYREWPEAWADVVSFERFMLGEHHADSTRPEHLARLQSFHRRYWENDSVSLHRAEGIRSYAVQLGDTVVARYWLTRVRASSSHDVIRIERRVSDWVYLNSTNPRAALDTLESAWSNGDSVAQMLALNGYYASRQARDAGAMLSWTDRLSRWNRLNPVGLLESLLQWPALRSEGVSRLRAFANQPVSQRDLRRPLEQSVADFVKADGATIARAWIGIGESLIADGNIRGGLDTIGMAIGVGWAPPLYRRVAPAYLSVGDTASAIVMLARYAADPGTSPTVSDSLRRAQLPAVPDAQWDVAVISARETMVTRLMEQASPRLLPAALRLVARSGETASLLGSLPQPVNVVAFWSEACGFSRQQLPQWPGLAARLDRFGIGFVAVTADSWSHPSIEYFDEQTRGNLALYYDAHREVGASLGQYSTPQYFVVEARGRVIFAGTNANQILAQAVAFNESTRR